MRTACLIAFLLMLAGCNGVTVDKSSNVYFQDQSLAGLQSLTGGSEPGAATNTADAQTNSQASSKVGLANLTVENESATDAQVERLIEAAVKATANVAQGQQTVTEEGGASTEGQ